MSKELDEAAEVYLRDTVEGWDKIPAVPQYDIDVFKAGVKWRDENPSEKVKALVKALERQQHPHVESFCKERAREALEQWRGK